MQSFKEKYVESKETSIQSRDKMVILTVNGDEYWDKFNWWCSTNNHVSLKINHSREG